jgi:hypothetical protein
MQQTASSATPMRQLKYERLLVGVRAELQTISRLMARMLTVKRHLLICAVFLNLLGCAMAQARYHSQANRYAICGSQRGSRQGFV